MSDTAVVDPSRPALNPTLAAKSGLSRRADLEDAVAMMLGAKRVKVIIGDSVDAPEIRTAAERIGNFDKRLLFRIPLRGEDQDSGTALNIRNFPANVSAIFVCRSESELGAAAAVRALNQRPGRKGVVLLVFDPSDPDASIEGTSPQMVAKADLIFSSEADVAAFLEKSLSQAVGLEPASTERALSSY